MEDRPAPSPAKLLTQFNDWVSETEMPGRTMSYLKTGFLPEVLTDQDTEATAAMLESWSGWEKGVTRPEIVLAALQEQGIVELLGSLTE